MSKIPKIPDIPDIPENEKTTFVTQLLEVIRYQGKLIQGLNNEIAVLKGNKPKPKIKPSKMENGREDNNDKKTSKNKRH